MAPSSRSASFNNVRQVEREGGEGKGTENGNMARLVHNLPPHCVPPPRACVRWRVGWIWPIFESDEKNEKERVRQWSRVISWTWRSRVRGSERERSSFQAFVIGVARHLLLLLRREGGGERTDCRSHQCPQQYELHRKHCMCMRLSPDLSASHTACIVLQGVPHPHRLG